MGIARQKKEQIKNNLEKIKQSTDKFNDVKKFPAFCPNTGNDNPHAINAYHHLMRLIFLRAKHLHASAVDAASKNDSYTSFVLLKAYWENVAMLGYCFVTANNLIDKDNYEELLNWVIRHALGGKKYPTDEHLIEICKSRDEFEQTNLLTMMQKVDKNFNKAIGKGVFLSDFEKVYNEFIAECGHSTSLGLSLCEEKQPDGSRIPKVDRTSQFDDNNMTINHICLANSYFFYYWGEFSRGIEGQIAKVSTP
ncbi:MAG TPA: hypothetical protein DEV73_04485 [Candidatus Zambryskibacteria bacterium]|nr:hypothetical protein [Candidatus Zambryskibacteria bacterium]